MIEMTCIVCPKGCRLQIEEKNGFQISGNGCERGMSYAISELTNPSRVVTSTVSIHGAPRKRMPVKTDRPIPKKDVFRAVRLLDNVELTSPVQQGTVVIKNVLDTGANFITTESL